MHFLRVSGQLNMIKPLLIAILHLSTFSEILGLDFNTIITGRMAIAMCSAVDKYQQTGILKPLKRRKLSKDEKASFYRRGGFCEKWTGNDKCFTFGLKHPREKVVGRLAGDQDELGCHECEYFEFGDGDPQCIEKPLSTPRKECKYKDNCVFTYYRDKGDGKGRGVKRECGHKEPLKVNSCLDTGDRFICWCMMRTLSPKGNDTIHCNHCAKGNTDKEWWDPPTYSQNLDCNGMDFGGPKPKPKTTTPPPPPPPPEIKGTGCHECEVWEFGSGDKRCVEEPWASPQAENECYYGSTCMFTYFRDTGSGLGRGVKRSCGNAFPGVQNGCVDVGNRVICRCNRKGPDGKDLIHCNHCSKGTAPHLRWDPPTEEENHLCEGIDLKYIGSQDEPPGLPT